MPFPSHYMQLWCVLFLVAGFAGPVWAQRPDTTVKLRNLERSQHSIDDDFVKIEYTLPYDGMVEFRLFTTDSALVYRSQYVQELGDNGIQLKKNALKSGTYRYAITYKGKNTYGEFSVVVPERSKPEPSVQAEGEKETAEERYDKMLEGFDLDF